MKQYSQLEIMTRPTEAGHIVRKVELDVLERQVQANSESIDEINDLLNGVSESLLTLENTVLGQ